MVELAASECAAKRGERRLERQPELAGMYSGAGLEGVDDHEVDGQQRECCEQQQDAMAAERAQ